MGKNIPQYILKALEKRKKASENFMAATNTIDKWLEKENIPFSYTTEDGDNLEGYVNSGCISLCEPLVANEGFIRIINDYFNKNIKRNG